MVGEVGRNHWIHWQIHDFRSGKKTIPPVTTGNIVWIKTVRFFHGKSPISHYINTAEVALIHQAVFLWTLYKVRFSISFHLIVHIDSCCRSSFYNTGWEDLFVQWAGWIYSCRNHSYYGNSFYNTLPNYSCKTPEHASFKSNRFERICVEI